MELPPVPLRDEGASALESTQFPESTQFREVIEMQKLQIYLRERGIEDQLGKDEVRFAVLWPTRPANVTTLRALGEQLRAWAASKRGIKRILGLQQLLEGRCPEVSATLLVISFSSAEPESCIESVALVTAVSGANTQRTFGKSLRPGRREWGRIGDVVFGLQ